MRWAAGLVGCALGASGLAAMWLSLHAADPWVVALAVSAAAWLAWVAFDFALAPLRAGGTDEAHRHSSEGAVAHGAFADSQVN